MASESMTPEPQAENRGAGGRDGDLDALRKQAFNQAARHGSCTAANDLVRLAKEARDERDEWKHLEGVEPTALRIRAEAAEAEIAALREERDRLNDQWSDTARLASEASAECLTLRGAVSFLVSVVACGEQLSEAEQQEMRALARGTK